ncbi:Flotillin-like protein 1 [Branchiostoma belcheri]|nr:Flotillin-like protein 1 [Branchiostoma belcheri]
MPFFETCGPNEAMVVSGCCHSRPLMVAGGRVFVIPCIQQLQRIPLNTLTLSIDSPTVYTLAGVPISVTGVAQVKIQGQNQEMLAAACQQFLGKSEEQIRRIALETLEGHQRAIMGTMTVEEIYQDRKKFAQAVFRVASTDFVNMGIIIVSYTLKDVRDEEGYLKALGMTRTAQVKKDARIGEAEAQRDSGIKEASAEEQRMKARFSNDTEIAAAQRDFELKKAAYDMETQTKKAEAELAYELQAAKTKQMIKEEQMQIKVVERAQQIQVQEQEIARRERELEAQIKRPAEAEKYRLETLAEANADYQEAAMVDMVLETLPKVVAEVAAPLSQTKKVTMVSSGKGELGAAKITGEVMDIVERLPQVVESMTGVDMSKPSFGVAGLEDAGKVRVDAITANADIITSCVDVITDLSGCHRSPC